MSHPDYAINVHWFGKRETPTSFAVEVRPHTGEWSPFYVAIPLAHREQVRPSTLRLSESGDAPLPDPKHIGDAGWLSEDGEWWITALAEGVVMPRKSAYYYCRYVPQAIVFGVIGGVQHRALLAG